MRSRRRRQVHRVYRGQHNARWRRSGFGRRWSLIVRALGDRSLMSAGEALTVEDLDTSCIVTTFDSIPLALRKL